MFTFTCEKCGKTVESKSDPSKWRSRLCYDCRNGDNKPMVNTSKTTTETKPYQPPKKSFDLGEYVGEMIVVYQTIKSMCEMEDVQVPETSMAQWTTSIMIQRDKANG